MNFPAFFLYEVSKMKHDASPVFVGCVVMASGRSQRFGSNKLLASFRGQPWSALPWRWRTPLSFAPGWL